jgi:hypothetical protein
MLRRPHAFLMGLFHFLCRSLGFFKDATPCREDLTPFGEVVVPFLGDVAPFGDDFALGG